MKKIKIGILGAAAFEKVKFAAKNVENIMLTSLMDTNRKNLENAAQTARNEGLYIKMYNNAEDFYAAEPDAVVASYDMYEYVRLKDTYLADGICDFDLSVSGVYAPSDNKLYKLENEEWKMVQNNEIQSFWNMLYVKNGSDPIFIYFFRILS